MEQKQKHSTSQLFNFTQDSYLERSSRPVYAIFFLMPFIVFYILGTFFMRTEQLSVLVDSFVWIQKSLEQIGFEGRMALLAPPLLVIVILVALQLTSGKKWRFHIGDAIPMTIESVMYAVPLLILSLVINSSAVPKNDIASAHYNAQVQTTVTCSAITAASEDSLQQRPLIVKIITSIGAGIYEELVFRLILICVLMVLFQDVFRLSHTNSIVAAILISAALFTAHHHIDFLSGLVNENDTFTLAKFTFRTIAGVYFAVLFAIRGFGIVVAAHAFYDILAVSINAIFFPG